MGYTTSVASFAASINDVDDLNVQRDFVSKMCYRGVEDKNRTMLSNLKSGLGSKINRILSYGRDTYPYGLPNGYTNFFPINADDLKATIEAEVGYSIEVSSSYVKRPELEFFAYAWFYQIGTYFEDLTPWITPVIRGFTKNQIEFYYDENGIIRRDHSEYSKFSPEIRTSNFYYHVRFRRAGTASTYRDGYWYYRIGSNVHPILEVTQQDTIGGPYLPIVPLRQDNRNLGPKFNSSGEYVYDDAGFKIVPDTELYRTSKYLCDLCNTDFNKLCKGVQENPDVDDIDHAYLMFGVDIRTNTLAGKRYIYEYFYDLSPSVFGDTTVRIADLKLDIQISFSGIVVTEHTGTLTAETSLGYLGNTLIISHRLTDTTYRRVTVTDLNHANMVYETYAVDTSLIDSADDDNYNFIIPLSVGAAEKIGNRFWRESLYTESLKMVFNCYERRRLKWYQSSWFQIIIIVLVIVLTITTGVGGEIVGAIAQGVMAVVTLAIQIAITSYVIGLAFAELVKALGVEWAAVLAIVAIVLSIALPGPGSPDAVVTAQDMLSIANGLITGINTELSANMEKLAEEMAKFSQVASELDEQLDALEDELDSDTWYDAFEFIGNNPLYVEGESPESYFNRTIHIGNIGTLALTTVESFVDSKLDLPTIQTSLGD